MEPLGAAAAPNCETNVGSAWAVVLPPLRGKLGRPTPCQMAMTAASAAPTSPTSLQLAVRPRGMRSMRSRE